MMKKCYILLLFNLLLVFSSTAQNVYAVSSGAWSNNLVWNKGLIPTCGNYVEIASSYTVTVSAQTTYTCTGAVNINIDGTLVFSTGAKLTLPAGSSVTISSTGSLDPGNGGGNSNLITIGSTNVWSASIGTVTGPVTITESSPLPIELISFITSPCNNGVCLNWSTASEKNNDYFTIEKTRDAVNYDFVAKVIGAGNSTALRDYSTEDNAPFEGISYYRLKQTDYNGNYTYSNLSQVNFKPTSSSFSFNVYPNPSSGDNITSNFNSDKGIEVLVKIYDATGREVYSKIIVAEQKGMNAFVLDASTKLAPGIYMITATSNGNFQSKKLIVK